MADAQERETASRAAAEALVAEAPDQKVGDFEAGAAEV